MIDPTQIKQSLVEAMIRPTDAQAWSGPMAVAAFLNALLADDEAMERACNAAWAHPEQDSLDCMRDAIIAAVTEES